MDVVCVGCGDDLSLKPKEREKNLGKRIVETCTGSLEGTDNSRSER